MIFTKRKSTPQLPLVSVVIINFNNSEYLLDCVDSVLNQTYKNVECIIVDDKSTDDSHQILRQIQRKYRDISVIFNKSERYQTICGYIGFKQCAGDFVIFLDADDYLMPQCIEMHIYAHLSSIVAIGFTVCESMQVCRNSLVRQNYTFFSSYVDEYQKNNAHASRLIKPIEKYLPEIWPYRSHRYETFATNFAMVNYGYDNLNDHRFYVTATSSNCFRRDAVACFFSKVPSSSMLDTKGSLDNYLICGIWLFSASLIINYPLVVRRIHNGSITGSAGVGAELMGFGVNLERIIGIAQTKVFQSLVENLISESNYFLKVTGKNSYLDAVLKLGRFMHNYCNHNTYANEMVHANSYILDAVNAAQQTLQGTLGKADFERLQRSLAGQ